MKGEAGCRYRNPGWATRKKVLPMKSMKWMTGWLVCLFSAALMMAPPFTASAAEVPAMTVGRIFYIEGDLLRYVPEEKDWVAVVRDAPFGAEDTLFSGSNGMAELIVPNGIWIRTGNSTQIQFITLDADLAEMDVASGMARFYSKGRAAIKVTSPFGYVLADPGTIFDLYVGENSIEAVAIKGTVSFVHTATDGRYDVAAGTTSILADSQQVSLGDGTVDPDWNRWNMDRENFWLARDQVKGPSVEYLPPDLRQDAYVFEENGRWERVPYEGQDRWFWRPTFVAVDWSPFTVGRWTDWYGDQTWIPAEPFGYVTHHYGNWIYARNHWYWAPPVVGVRIGLPLLDIGFFWYPGRVAWIHGGVNVGWVPLAPRETYYSHRQWGGPHTMVVNNINVNRININIGSHAYVDHAIIVNRSNFLGRDDYRNVRVTNINHTTVINNYRTAPVVDNKVIKNFSTTRQRYDFTNAPVLEKPHNTVINRIQHNERIIHESRKEKASVLQERLKAIPKGRINREVRVEQPRGANHIVPTKEVNRPKAGIQLPQREIKGGGRGVPSVEPGQAAKPSERVIPSRPAQHEKTQPRTERVAPMQSAQQGQSVKPSEQVIPERLAQPEQQAPRTERVVPARPSQQGQPVKPFGRVIPERLAQPEQQMPITGRVAPVLPTQSTQSAKPFERVIPARPAQPEQQAPRTERVVPARPSQPGQYAKPSERVIPARPAQPEQQMPRTERVTPARPAQPAQPAQPFERVIPARPAQPEQVRPENTTSQPEPKRKKTGHREQPE
jgi:hypothetical protein